MIDTRAIERLREIVGDLPADLIEMIESFLEEGPVLLDRMRSALDLGDTTALRRTAHALKSNARDFGANGLAGLCAELEDDLRAGRDIGEGASRLQGIVGAWTAVEPELRRLIAEIRTY